MRLDASDMLVRVVGASRDAIRQLRAIAPAGMDVVDEPIAEPDWILVATASQRLEAVASSRLPPFRVLEAPEIAEVNQSPSDALRTALVRISGIGARRLREAPFAVRLTALIIRRLMKAQ